LLDTTDCEAAIELYPFQGPFAQGIDQCAGQDENEDNPFHYREERKSIVGHGPGEQKNCLNIKYQEYQGKDVILNLELHPCVTNGLDAALVGAVLKSVGFARAEDTSQQDGYKWKSEAHDKEHTYENPFIHGLTPPMADKKAWLV
jgi:hypothetical protein